MAGVTFLILGIVLLSKGIMFKAIILKFAMFNMSLLIVLCGLHLVESHTTPTRFAKGSIWFLGLFVAIFSIVVIFDIVDAKATWNLLIGLAVVFITLVQLQLMKWEKSKNLLKLLGLITLLSNIFIAVYFLAMLSFESLGIMLDITVIASVFSFLIGLILSRQKKSKLKKAEA